MDPLEFLGGQEPEITDAAPQVEAIEPEPVEPAAEAAPGAEEGPVRDEKGRFAPKTGQEREPGHVPITALMDERDKRKAAEDRLRQYETQEQGPYIDEDTAAVVHNATLKVKLDISEDLAREKHGDEVVDQVIAWAQSQFQNRPGFYAEVMSHRNPYGHVIQQYQRDQMVSQLTPDDFAAFQAWKQTRAQAPAQPAAAPAAPSTPTPPRSIASAPNAGGTKPGEQPVGPGVAFDSIFTR